MHIALLYFVHKIGFSQCADPRFKKLSCINCACYKQCHQGLEKTVQVRHSIELSPLHQHLYFWLQNAKLLSRYSIHPQVFLTKGWH